MCLSSLHCNRYASVLPSKAKAAGRTPVSYGFLQLLESTHFDLSNTLTTNAKLGSEVFQRQVARQDDELPSLFTRIYACGVDHQIAACVVFLYFSKVGFLIGALVFQPVLPLTGAFAITVYGDVQERSLPAIRWFIEIASRSDTSNCVAI